MCVCVCVCMINKNYNPSLNSYLLSLAKMWEKAGRIKRPVRNELTANSLFFYSFNHVRYLRNTWCLNIYGTHLTANNSNNNVEFSFISDLKIV